MVVTGVSSGIGLATALALLTRDAKVFGCDISRDPERLSSFAGKTFGFLKVDLAQPGSPEKVIKACIDHFGTVDALLNVAGIGDT